MQAQEPESRRLLARPLRAVIDTCVFPHTRRWLAPLIDHARNGHVKLFWSPAIIAEANRLLTWLWLDRHDSALTDAAWNRCSAAAHRMFARLTTVFHVSEDRPPPEALWSPRPLDEWDVPIWTAAVRAKADFIVTENLKDGPPPDGQGLRRHGDITYVHPDQFLALVDWWADAAESAQLPALPGETTVMPELLTSAAMGEDETVAKLAPSVFAFLAAIPTHSYISPTLARPRDP
ncbi:MAG: PIN domain-containing protein [Chloroflexi bacterium]|nr:PIN domain-containing protein [Chloroflexota bacterium]